MNIKAICFGVAALSMVAGSALAAQGDGAPWGDTAKMGSFYADENMKTLKTGDEFKAAWMKMSPEDQAAMTTACADEMKASKTEHADFCKAIGNDAGSGGMSSKSDTSTN